MPKFEELNKKDYSFFSFIMLSIAVFGVIFLAWIEVKNNDLGAGVIYAIMLFAFTSLLFLVFFWVSDDKTLKPITNYLKVPIATKETLAISSYSIGFMLPLLINSIIKLAKGTYNIATLSIPLFGSAISKSFQSYSTAIIGTSMAWKLFIIMFVAGTIETFVYNFGAVLFGIVIALGIYNMINGGKELGWIDKKTFVLIIAFGISIGFFTVSHLMNGTYTPSNFIAASIFLLIANISIYLGGAFLMFWAGYHQANNLLWLIQENGLQQVLNGFVSWFGIVFILYWILIIWFIIKFKDQIWSDLTKNY